MRNVRDLAAVHQWLLGDLAITRAAGASRWSGSASAGWVAAEMATQAPRAFRKLVLVGAMGLKPDRGVIADQALVSYIDYVRLGFSDQSAFDRSSAPSRTTSRLEHWDLNREMSLPHRVEALHVQPVLAASPRRHRHAHRWWSGGATIASCPSNAASATPKRCPGRASRSIEGAGHFVEMEKPTELAQLVTDFVSQGDA